MFLIGFPRSGTTLLEKALGSHPGVATLEEVDVLVGAGMDLLDSPGGLSRLQNLSSEQLAIYRRAMVGGDRGAGPGMPWARWWWTRCPCTPSPCR